MGNLGATLDQIAWVSTGYIVANVIVLPITGWLSAYFGRRRYFAGSIALFTFASFMCATPARSARSSSGASSRDSAAARCSRRRRRFCTRNSRARSSARRWPSSASA